MKINTAKAKMLAGGTAFGFELGMGSATIAEALSRTGIDYLQLDNQHGDWGPDSTIAALIAMEGGTATPMARVARNDYTMIGRLLDEGMLGIIVPMVHTAEDAKAAADACRFPPLGTRSCGWGRIGRNDPDYRYAAGDGRPSPRRRWLLPRLYPVLQHDPGGGECGDGRADDCDSCRRVRERDD